MLSFEQAKEALSEIADGLPQEIYRDLSGGIILLPDVKISEHSIGNDLYTLGEYHYEPVGLGRYVTIYYGSFCRVYGGLAESEQVEKLRGVLRHELVHHLESMAGDRSLEIQDELDLEEYYQRYE